MNDDPDFFLTAAGEYRPLAEPRACWVQERLLDAKDNDYVLVEMRPSFSATDAPGTHVSSVVLSARHEGDSVAYITSWPAYVYVSQVLDPMSLQSQPFDVTQLGLIAWARLYPNIESATQDAERHAAAVHSMRSPETIHAPQVRFLGEQDGIPERMLKEKLVRLFVPGERIWKAYLARVDFGPGTAIGVTLCLRTVMGPDSRIAVAVGEVFTPMYRVGESLDILFIDDEQERELAPVCAPFYVRTILRRG